MLHRGFTHKWLGCMLCTATTGNHTLDLAHQLHAASQPFLTHRPQTILSYLENRNVAMQDRLRHFHAMVTPVACFGAVQRRVYKHL